MDICIPNPNIPVEGEKDFLTTKNDQEEGPIGSSHSETRDGGGSCGSDVAGS